MLLFVIGLVLGIVVMGILYFLFVHPQITALEHQLADVQYSHRSNAVRHGKNWEQFVPFMKDFETITSKENFSFLGMPIDGISFDDDSIKFIEIKTGSSTLNAKQRKVRDLVKQKKVEWHELRY